MKCMEICIPTSVYYLIAAFVWGKHLSNYCRAQCLVLFIFMVGF